MKRLLAFEACQILLILLFSACQQKEPGLSENELIAIRDSFDIRVAETYLSYKGKPLVRSRIRSPLEADRPGRPVFSRDYSWSLVTYATRCFWNKKNIDSANYALQENADFYLNNLPELVDRDNTHWHSEMLLRLIEFYGQGGSKDPGLLTAETENKILEHLWLYSKREETNARAAHISLADHKTTSTWAVMESENHHVQSFSTLWHFAKLAKDRPDFKDRIYDDGLKASDHYALWNEYIHMFLTERARKGLFVEMMSVSYNIDLLKGVFNFYDFAEDESLKLKTGKLFDLYFAYWGQEQFGGISGGGKSRIYSDINPGSSGYGYYFFGIGDKPGLEGKLLTAMTTSYRPPLVVVDIVRDYEGRGTYEVSQRPQGLVDTLLPMRPAYPMRTDSGGIHRYSYCTPGFIMGTQMLPSRPEREWALISSQNRSHGVYFAGEPVSVILPQCENNRLRRAYNSQWSVQRKGTMIVQKLKHNRYADKTRVWFSKNGLSEPIVENGWVFAEARKAYAAVHVVDGGFYWDTTKNANIGKWLYCENEFSPIVLDVVEKSNYRSFQEFRDVVKKQTVDFQDNILNYKGLYGDSFTFYADHSHSPKINGVTVNYAPEMGFDSPFLQSVWNSGIVTIKKGEQELVLDFNN